MNDISIIVGLIGGIMGLVALIIAFEYTGFYMLQSVFGIDEGGLGLRIFSIVFFALAMLTFLFKSERKHKDWWYLVIFVEFKKIEELECVFAKSSTSLNM